MEFSEIGSFIDEEKNEKCNKKLVEYLKSCRIVASTSRSGFAPLFDGEETSGSVSYRTDGEWLWLDVLAEYVDRYNVVIPDKWYEDIEKRNFVVPFVCAEKLESLDWPFLRIDPVRDQP